MDVNNSRDLRNTDRIIARWHHRALDQKVVLNDLFLFYDFRFVISPCIITPW